LVDQRCRLRRRLCGEDLIALRGRHTGSFGVLHFPCDELRLFGGRGLCNRFADYLLEVRSAVVVPLPDAACRAAVSLGAIPSAFDVEVPHEASDDGSRKARARQSCRHFGRLR
jgi:hypothetical protein